MKYGQMAEVLKGGSSRWRNSSSDQPKVVGEKTNPTIAFSFFYIFIDRLSHKV